MEEKELLLTCVQVEKGVQALLQVIKKTEEKKNELLLQDDHAVNLQFATKKTSRVQKSVKLKLPNGLGEKNKEVCLFVKDLDKSDREYEKSVRHFKAFLKTKDISCVSEVIPLKALKLEYKPFEAKRNLSNRFDIFLADARIIRLLPAYLGKAFFGRKRQPVQIRMDAKDLKAEFEAAVNNSRCLLTGKGSVGMAAVGRSSMSVAELVQNITASAQQIVAALPGGAQNIRNFYIKTEDSMAIPIYTSLGSTNDVVLPQMEKQREPIVAEEVTTVENALVKVYPRGEVKVVDLSGKAFRRPAKAVKRSAKGLKQPTKALKRAGKRGPKQTVGKVKGQGTAKAGKEKPKGKKKKK